MMWAEISPDLTNADHAVGRGASFSALNEVALMSGDLLVDSASVLSDSNLAMFVSRYEC